MSGPELRGPELRGAELRGAELRGAESWGELRLRDEVESFFFRSQLFEETNNIQHM